MWSVCTVGCCPALERKEILTHATWMNLEDIMLSEISQSQRDKYHRICLCEVPGAVNTTETESGQWVPGAGGVGGGMDTGELFHGDRWWWRLHTTLSVLSTTKQHA